MDLGVFFKFKTISAKPSMQSFSPSRKKISIFFYIMTLTFSETGMMLEISTVKIQFFFFDFLSICT